MLQVSDVRRSNKFPQFGDIPLAVRPLLGVGAIALVMFGMAQLMQNQFGMDRDGFRVYVLTSAPRSDILLGKNLAIVPLAVGMCLVSLTALQLFLPMQTFHFLATIVQIASCYLVFCMIGNLTSILAPMAIKPGSLHAAKPTAIVMLVQFGCMMLFPLALAPMLIPLGIDVLLDELGWRGMIPVYLILSILQAALVLWIYKRALAAQGRMLQQRERKVLETVTTQSE